MNSQKPGPLAITNAKAQVALQTIAAQNLTGTLKTLQNNILQQLLRVLSVITGIQIKIKEFAKNAKDQLEPKAGKSSQAESLQKTNKRLSQIRVKATNLRSGLAVFSDAIASQVEFLRLNAVEGTGSGNPFFKAIDTLDAQLSLLQNELKFVLGNLDNIIRDSAPQKNPETAHLFSVALVKELEALAREVK